MTKAVNTTKVVSGYSHHRSVRSVFASMRARVGPCTPVDIVVLPRPARLRDDRREHTATYRGLARDAVPVSCEIPDSAPRARGVSDGAGGAGPPAPGRRPLPRRRPRGPRRAR